MKVLQILFALLLMVFVAAPAMASAVPSGNCSMYTPGWDPDNPYERCRYTLDDMGSFDVNGAWVWDLDFETQTNEWSSNNDVNWRVSYAPYQNAEGTFIPILWLTPGIPEDPRLYLDGDFGEGGVMNFELVPGTGPSPGLLLTEGYGNDFYYDNMFDVRTYDATHPNFGNINSIGGLTVGIDIINMDVADQISRVEIVSVGGNIEQKIVLTSPDIFNFLGDPMHIYTMVIGSKFQTAPQYDVFVYDLNGVQAQFQNYDGTLAGSWSIFPDMEQVLPPVTKLHKAVLTKNKGVRVKFTAPFDVRDGEIRIRIMDANGMIKQFRDRSDVNHPEYLAGLAKDANGHYFFTKKDGTVVLDKVKVFIPVEYAGFDTRIEYRIYDGDTVLRGITTFTSPAPEPVVEEEPEVTVVECPDESGLAFVQDGACVCPDTYTYVEGIGCQ